jgi:hypothetical protein
LSRRDEVIACGIEPMTGQSKRVKLTEPQAGRIRPTLASMEQGAPIVVRVDPGTIKGVTTALGIVVGVMVAIAVFQPELAPVGHRYTPLQRFAYVGGFSAFFLLCMIAVRRSHVALYTDRVEVTVALLPTRRIARSDVVARSTKPGRWRPIPVLVLKDGRRVSMPVYLERNREFSAWLNSLPYRRKRSWFRP